MKTNLLLVSLLFIIVLSGCTQQSSIQKIEVAGVRNPVTLLNGTWKFSMAPPDKFWENGVNFKNWDDILVPGECQMQGFAIKHDTPYAYKTEFEVPEDYAGKQIKLNFYGVYSYARVWINASNYRNYFHVQRKEGYYDHSAQYINESVSISGPFGVGGCT